MKRDLAVFSQPFDIAIVGAGVIGACIARLSALYGLKVALIDRGDFGGETSRNCAKLLHGGLRYLQGLDLPRIRESVRAQRAWFRMAPHLVRPLRVIVPTRGFGLRGAPLMAAGFLAHSLLSADRNRKVDSRIRLPGPGFMSIRGSAIESVLRGVAMNAEVGYWYDGQMLDASRLVLECVRDAAEAGAVVANHVECVSLLRGDRRVSGIAVIDRLEDKAFEIRAKVTINAAGPSIEQLAATRPASAKRRTELRWTRNLNLVTRRLYQGADALGIENSEAFRARTRTRRRTLFVSPWHGCSIVGTSHETSRALPEDLDSCDTAIDTLIEEAADALPAVGLVSSDIRSIHVGFTPSDEAGAFGANRSLLLDHATIDRIEGLISVIGNKYTTAPEVAIRVLSLVRTHVDVRRLAAVPMSSTHDASAVNRRLGSPSDSAETMGCPIDNSNDVDEYDWATAVYGNHALRCLSYIDGSDREARSVFKARVLYGVDCEMICTLADAIFRATDWAERGRLEKDQFDWCARALAAALGWDESRTTAEHAQASALLKRHRIQLVDSTSDTADGVPERLERNLVP